jgi:hypothetical protein
LSNPGADRTARRQGLPAFFGTVVREFTELPSLVRFGFVVVVAGGVIDLGYHLLLAGSGGGVDRVGYAGHLVTLAGMLVSMVGVFRTAVHPERRGNVARHLESPAPTQPTARDVA